MLADDAASVAEGGGLRGAQPVATSWSTSAAHTSRGPSLAARAVLAAVFVGTGPVLVAAVVARIQLLALLEREQVQS